MKKTVKYKILFWTSILISVFSCKNSDNEIVVKRLHKDVSEDTIALRDNLYRVKKNNGYIIAKREKDSIVIISDTLYNEIYVSGNNVLLRKGNKFRVFDSWKETFILPKYDVIANTNIHKEFLVVDNQKTGIVNYENDTIIPLKYDRIYNLKYSANNYYSYYHYVVEKDGKCGLFQTDEKHLGKLVLPIDYDAIVSVSEKDSTAIVSVDNKCGVVKLDSKRVIIPIIYDEIQKKKDCYYLSQRNKVGVVYLNSIPETLQMFDEIISYNSESKSIVFKNSKKKGIYDVVNNKIILEPKYDKINKIEADCKNDNGKFAIVSIDNKLGIVKLYENKVVIPVVYDDIEKINREYYTTTKFKIRKSNKYGIIDINGNLLIPIEYDYLYQPYNSKNSIIVVKQGKYGVVNWKNNIKLPFEYESVKVIEDNFFQVKKNSKYGIVDKFNRVKLPLRYNYIFVYKNGFMSVSIKNGKKGVLNNKGREVIPTIYDNIFFYRKNKLYIVEQNNKRGIITSNGKTIIPPLFAWVEIINQNLFLITDNNFSFFIDRNFKPISSLFKIHRSIQLDNTNCYVANRNRKMGVISNENKIIIPFVYDTIIPVSNYYKKNNFIVSKKQKYGLINKAKTIIDCKYSDFFIESYGYNIFLFNDKETLKLQKYNYEKTDTIKGRFVGKFNRKKYIFKGKTNYFVYNDNTLIDCDSMMKKEGSKYKLSNIIIKNGKYGYFQNKDTYLKCQFDTLSDLNGRAFLIKDKNKFGVYYTNDSIPLVQPRYDSIYSFLNRGVGDLFFCYRNNKTDLYNEHGYIETFNKIIQDSYFLYSRNLNNGLLLRTEHKDIVVKEQNSKYKSFFENSNYVLREIGNHGILKNKNAVRFKDIFNKKGNIIVIFKDLNNLIRNKYLITKWKLLFNTDVVFIYNQPNISEKTLNEKIRTNHLLNEIDYFYWYPFDNLPIDKLSVYLNKDNLNFEWEDNDYLHEIDDNLQNILGY